MGSQSSKLVTETQLKQEHAINYMNSGGSMSGKSGQSLKQAENHKDNKEIVHTNFKWNFGGNKVFVTGTFNKWVNPIQLQKDKGGEFKILLPLPKGVHHYKFIVDGEWRFSPDDPTAPDEQGNINNIIDTTQGLIDTSQQDVRPFQKKSNEQVQALTTPKPAQQTPTNFNDQAPLVPPHLLHFSYIKEKEKRLNKLWNEKVGSMEEEGNPSIPTQDAFDCLIQTFSNVTALSPPPHVTLNHLGSLNLNGTDPYNCFCLTHRFKAKYTTIKFFAKKTMIPPGEHFVEA